MQAVDQPGDIRRELLFDPFLCIGIELMHRKKQSGEARVGIEAQRGRNQRHAEDMAGNLFACPQAVAGVNRFNELERPPDAGGIGRRQTGAEFFQRGAVRQRGIQRVMNVNHGATSLDDTAPISIYIRYPAKRHAVW